MYQLARAVKNVEPALLDDEALKLQNGSLVSVVRTQVGEGATWTGVDIDGVRGSLSRF